MYEKIVDEDPYVTPMMIYPAVHYTMGGTWVDNYKLQFLDVSLLESLISLITELID
jgi:succinate dehydrogenase/fumarate reductase flavoprotein subunit